MARAQARRQEPPGNAFQEFFGGLADTGRSLIEGVRAFPGAAREKARRERDEASMLRDPRIVGATRQALIRGEVSRPEQPPLTLEAIKAMAGEGTTARKVGRVTGEVGLMMAAGPLGRTAKAGTQAAVRGIRGAVRRVTAPRAPRQLSLLEDIPAGRPVAVPGSDAAASVGVTPSPAPRVPSTPARTPSSGTPAPTAATEPVQGTLNLTGGPPRGLDGSLITTKQVFAEPTSGRLHTVIDVKPDGRILVAETGRELGTRKPSFFIVPEESNAINFANPRRGLAQAFAKTGEVSKTIQEGRAGLNSDQRVRGVEGVTPASTGVTRGGQRLVKDVSPASTLRRDLAVTGAGAGAGAAAGAALGLDDPVGSALTGALVGAGLTIRGQSRLASLSARGVRGWDVLLLLRREGYLSGLALPKNIATALGALPIAAAETRSIQPLKEIPRLVGQLAKGLVTPKNVIPIEEGIAGRGMAGFFGPRIGATDFSLQDALRRGLVRIEKRDATRLASVKRKNVARKLAGKKPRSEVMPERGIGKAPKEIQAQIDRAALTTPLSKTLSPAAVEVAKSPGGQFLFPFQRTGVNLFKGGIEEALELAGKGPGPPSGALGTAARRRLISAGAAGAGLATGEALKGEGIPGALTAAVLGAALSRRQMLFSVGAAATGGRQFLRGLSPISEQAGDIKQFFPTEPNDIALFRLLEQMTR